MLRQADKGQLAARVSVQRRAVILKAPTRHACGQLTQCVKQRVVTQQQCNTAVLNHVVQTFQRVFGVERDISATGLENRQQANHHFQRALQRQPHPHLRANPAFAQHPGQTIGLTVEFGITQVLPGKGQRNGIRAHTRLLGK